MSGAADDCTGYLADESNFTGHADSILFPHNTDDVRRMLAELSSSGETVTVQSGLTGITGGAVPEGGAVINCSRMRSVLGLRCGEDGRFYVRIQAGYSLAELRDALEGGAFDVVGWSEESLAALDAYRASGTKLFFPPDLTETSACFGGIVANNGSGARTFMYGATREHVSALSVVLADGDLLELRRGAGARSATGRGFSLTTAGGRELRGRLPEYSMPEVKNAAGYYARDDMELIDLFIGSEGTLCIITEVELTLTPLPDVMWGITAFFADESGALDYVEAVRAGVGGVAAIEFFSAEALELLRVQQSGGSGIFGELPVLRPEWNTAVYVELHAASEDEAADALESVSEFMENCGGDPDATWFAEGRRDIERFKGIRHAVPEAVNLLIRERAKKVEGLTKLGTDLAVPDSAMRQVMAMYHHDLRGAGLDYVIFGHIGNNHVHVNILPKDMDEYRLGKEMYLDWARRVVELGGSVSAEHGIGKLKREMLRIMYGDDGIEQMRAVKQVFDPAGVLGRGTLWT